MKDDLPDFIEVTDEVSKLVYRLTLWKHQDGVAFFVPRWNPLKSGDENAFGLPEHEQVVLPRFDREAICAIFSAGWRPFVTWMTRKEPTP